MHIVLTDVLTCPACGEGQGLVARADRIIHRRIESGALGCAVCRRQYSVREGVAYLVAEDDSDHTGPQHSDPDLGASPEEAVRIAALLGLDRVNGFVLLMGRASRHAPQVAALAENVEIVTADLPGNPPVPVGTVSQLVLGAGLPFYPGKLRGIWLADAFADTHLEAATVALQPTARLVLDPAPADAEDRLPPEFRVVATQGRTLVCERAA